MRRRASNTLITLPIRLAPGLGGGTVVETHFARLLKFRLARTI